MGTVLFVLTQDEVDEELLRAAEQHVIGTDQNVLFCRIIEESRYQSAVERRAESGREIGSIEELEEVAKEEADEIATTRFGRDDRATALGIVGRVPDDILRVAEERDCTHVFVSGKKRSPAGKAVFGDIAQSVLLQFDGPVTVTTVSS